MLFRKKTNSYNEQKELLLQILDAKEQLKMAEYNFNHCDPDWFEIANAELTLCNDRVNLLYMKAKKIADGSVNFDKFCKESY